MSRFHQDRESAKRIVETLENKYNWIESEKQFFGKPKTDYDFSDKDIKKVEKKLSSLIKQQSELEKTINKKVVSMISE